MHESINQFSILFHCSICACFITIVLCLNIDIRTVYHLVRTLPQSVSFAETQYPTSTVLAPVFCLQSAGSKAGRAWWKGWLLFWLLGSKERRDEPGRKICTVYPSHTLLGLSSLDQTQLLLQGGYSAPVMHSPSKHTRRWKPCNVMFCYVI